MKIILIMTLMPFFAFAAVYGVDDRVYITSKSSKDLATGVAIMVPKTFLKSVPNSHSKQWQIETEPLGDIWNLCPSQKFLKSPALPISCTGFLVAPDILMTAGHCAVNTGFIDNINSAYCSDFVWMFDFQKNTLGEVNTQQVKQEQIFECEKILYAVHDSDLRPNIMDFKKDFAFIQLKRSATNRTIFKWSAKAPQKKDPIYMLGYPLGGPLMRTQGEVLSLHMNYFRANLAAFDGNSGSPVLNKRHEVVGLLVRGYPESFREVSFQGQSCSVVNRCDRWAQKCESNNNISMIGEHVQTWDSVMRFWLNN